MCNAVTQKYYGRTSGKVYVDYNAVRRCFKLVNTCNLILMYDTVNFPLIGAGLGGDWEIISKIIDEELDDSLNKVLWLRE